MQTYVRDLPLTANGRSIRVTIMQRTYVRRRATALAIILAMATVGATGVTRALGEDRRPAMARSRTYVVRSGDTLWSIALRTDPTADPRTVVDELVEANRLGSASIAPGQRLVLPA